MKMRVILCISLIIFVATGQKFLPQSTIDISELGKIDGKVISKQIKFETDWYEENGKQFSQKDKQQQQQSVNGLKVYQQCDPSSSNIDILATSNIPYVEFMKISNDSHYTMNFAPQLYTGELLCLSDCTFELKCFRSYGYLANYARSYYDNLTDCDSTRTCSFIGINNETVMAYTKIEYRLQYYLSDFHYELMRGDIQVTCDFNAGIVNKERQGDIIIDRILAPELEEYLPGLCTSCDNNIQIGKYLEFDITPYYFRFAVCLNQERPSSLSLVLLELPH